MTIENQTSDETKTPEQKAEAEKKTPEAKVDDTNKDEQGGEKKELTQEEKDQLEADKKAKEEAKNKKQSRLDRRFRSLTDKVKSANADAASWRETLKELTGEDPPKREDFETPEEFQEAISEYREKIRGPKAQLEHAERKAAEAQGEYDKALVDSWGERVEDVLEELPDYKETVKKANIPMTEAMLKAILRSSLGPQITYYLAKNQDEAYDILDLSENEQIQAIGRLESKVQAGRNVEPEVKVEKQKKEPNPPPTGEKPKGEKQTSKKDPANMSLEEYAKWRREGGGT